MKTTYGLSGVIAAIIAGVVVWFVLDVILGVAVWISFVAGGVILIAGVAVAVGVVELGGPQRSSLPGTGGPHR